MADQRAYGPRPMQEQPSVKRRVRAAMILADVDFNDLAKRIATRGLASRTLRKIADENDTRQPKDYELDKIAQAMRVPAWFLHHGFSVEELEPSVAERLERIEHALEAHGLLPATPPDRQSGMVQAADSAEQAGRQRAERPPNPSSTANGQTQEPRSS